MPIPSRNVTITGIFAEDATTTIPETPVSGTSYRDDTITESDIAKGFPFKTIVDSSQFNQALFEYSSITKMQEKYGFVPWSNLTDYETGSVCLGTNGVLYQAKQPTGPSSTAYDPVNDTTGTYWTVIVLGGGLQIGDIGIAAFGIDETLNRRRYLNGQVISQTQFGSFTSFLKNAISTYPSLGTTEALWQQEVSNSDLGQCGKFVVDNVNGTIRLPKIVNIQGLQTLSGNLGTTISAGLPNITGSFGGGQAQTQTLGAFYVDGNAGGINGTTYSTNKVGFNASRSSSIYGNSSTVQEEAVQYPYFIQVATGGETNVDVTTEIQLSNPFFFGMYQWFQTDPNNASWLAANGAYNAKTVYPSYYDWLLSIYNDTGSITGFNVKDTTDTYTDYDFVLNLNDETFRLPTKVHGKTGDAVVGNGMTLGWSDGESNYGTTFNTSNGWGLRVSDGYGSAVGSNTTEVQGAITKSYGITSDPTKSGIEVDTTGMSLYFYVGAVVQDADVINAGAIINEVATLNSRPHIVETYHSGTDWYHVWSDGFCEQGGVGTENVTTNLLKPYADTNYSILLTPNFSGNFVAGVASKTTTGFVFSIGGDNTGSSQAYWFACGYIS